MQTYFKTFNEKEDSKLQLVMLNMKTQKCDIVDHLNEPHRYLHECANYHGNFDKKRPLFDYSGKLKYSQVICSNILAHQLLTKTCPDTCPYSHNNFEENFHPTVYLTIKCKDQSHIDLFNNNEASNTKIFTCPYYHENQQKRFDTDVYTLKQLEQYTSPDQSQKIVTENLDGTPIQSKLSDGKNSPGGHEELKGPQEKLIRYQTQNSLQPPQKGQSLQHKPKSLSGGKTNNKRKQYAAGSSSYETVCSKTLQNEEQKRYSTISSHSSSSKFQSSVIQQASYTSESSMVDPSEPLQFTDVYKLAPIQAEIDGTVWKDKPHHLNLSQFKTELCTNSNAHNHKHCKFYHSNKDRRRKIENIIPEMCEHSETDNCPNQDQCKLAHNRVERLYHIEKYKTKFCTKFPQKLADCDYGTFCSFAHSTTDIKTRLIHFMTKDDDFYMFYFKTEWCPFNREHNKAICNYAHNWQDFRRRPHIFEYNAFEMCSNWQAGTFISKYEEGCKLQSSCPKSHGWKEKVYHPLVYKSQPCTDTNCGGANVQCPFYHNQNDRRNVNESNLRQIMNPRQRMGNECLAQINVYNLVINNINHLKELIINYGFPWNNFALLQKYFENYKIPMIILQYIEEKIVVPSQKTLMTIQESDEYQKQFQNQSDPKQNIQTQQMQFQKQVQSEIQNHQVNLEQYQQQQFLESLYQDKKSDRSYGSINSSNSSFKPKSNQQLQHQASYSEKLKQFEQQFLMGNEGELTQLEATDDKTQGFARNALQMMFDIQVSLDNDPSIAKPMSPLPDKKGNLESAQNNPLVRKDNSATNITQINSFEFKLQQMNSSPAHSSPSQIRIDSQEFKPQGTRTVTYVQPNPYQQQQQIMIDPNIYFQDQQQQNYNQYQYQMNPPYQHNKNVYGKYPYYNQNQQQ